MQKIGAKVQVGTDDTKGPSALIGKPSMPSANHTTSSMSFAGHIPSFTAPPIQTHHRSLTHHNVTLCHSSSSVVASSSSSSFSSKHVSVGSDLSGGKLNGTPPLVLNAFASSASALTSKSSTTHSGKIVVGSDTQSKGKLPGAPVVKK